MLIVHSLYIFDRCGQCLYQKDWVRPRKTNSDIEDQKLMYGMFFSLRAFCKNISPVPGCTGFSSYVTRKYKLHYYETASGYKFILTTDPGAGDLSETLQHLYANVFVELVVMDPAFNKASMKLGEHRAFVDGVDRFVRALQK